MTAPEGSPVGRRLVLAMLGLAAVGVAVGSRVTSALSTAAQNDPTGLLNLVPGSGRFRFYSVAGPVQPMSRDGFRLQVDGAVRRPTTLTFEDLAAMPQTSLVKDVQCVTGWRVLDVRWSGVRLSDLLDEVGVSPEAGGAVLFGSSDGIYTESLTMEQARRPDVLVATSLDGEPVSNAHGGPVRLYVAPMYFYKSLKWLNRITVTTAVEPGYWEERGYDTDAWVGQSNGRTDAPIT